MKQILVQLPAIHLVGIQTRTSNQAELKPNTAQIGPTVQRYFQEQLAERIPHRKKPGITYSVYTDYESDFRGAYTYFIGEEVLEEQDLPEGFKRIVLPPQNYVKFTTDLGPMPQVVIAAWQQIWQMSETGLGGSRLYQADFELYDARAQDPQKAIVDLYIGVKVARHNGL